MSANNSSAQSDVAIIGAGLIGCSIALRLAQQKVRVRVFDRGEPGAEASSAGAGMIAPQGETTEPDAFYQLCAASRDFYPDFVAEVEEISGEGVGLRREGTLMVSLDETSHRELDHIYSCQTKVGLSLEWLLPEDARRLAPQVSRQIRSAVFIAGDYCVDNEKLARAVYKACLRLGVTFHINARVAAFNAYDGRIESVAVNERSQAAPARFIAGQFVLAAGAWSGEISSSLGLSLPMKPCRGAMIEFDGAPEFPLVIRAGHHYLVPRSEGRLLAGSTMEYTGFEKVVTAGGLRSILEGAERIVPGIKSLRFRRAWAGLRPDTADHWPILGYGEWKNLVFATGHFRNGILLTPVTAKLIAELIMTGSPSLSLEPYSSLRFSKNQPRAH